MQHLRNETRDTLANLKTLISTHLDQYSDGEVLLFRDDEEKSYIGIKNGEEYMDLFDVTSTPEKMTYNPHYTSILPDGYTEVEYIENQSQAYINTGVYLYSTVTNSYTISGKVYPVFTSGGGDNQTFINAEGVTSPYYGMVYRLGSSAGIFKFDTNPSGNATLSSETLGDGSIQFTITSTATNCTNTIPLGLFCSWQNATPSPYRYCKGKMYRLQITLNDTLTRDLIPCTRDSDSKVGMYDIVNDVFYTTGNSSYNFVAGPNV